MTERLNYAQQSPQMAKKMLELSTSVKDSAIDQATRDLVEVRASQLNGCGFCLDMHVKQAKLHGERELRLYHVAVWRESPLFSPRERAALAWTEALTRLPEHGVSDALYEQARAEFSEKELSDLTFAVTVINSWNRLAVAFRIAPGSKDAAYGLDKAGLA